MALLNKPYIGITGFMSREEIDEVSGIFKTSCGRVLMAGVLASSKTVAGKPNKWPGRYPRVENIKNIFGPHENTLNLIHYSTDEPETLLFQLVGLHKLGGRYLHGFQLNMTWPSIKALEEYFKAIGKIIILQIGNRALEEIERNPKKLADRITGYIPFIDSVLIDPSGGLGKVFNAAEVLGYLDELYSRRFRVGIGVAGGFGPFSLDHFDKIIETYPSVSIDAEGKLRTPQPDDLLDINLAKRYVFETLLRLKTRLEPFNAPN